MATDLDMNGHVINGLTLKQTLFITGYYNGNASHQACYLGGIHTKYAVMIIPNNITILSIQIRYL